MSEVEYFQKKIQENYITKFGRWTNFKIICHLSSPVCLTTPWLNFDSLIGHFMFIDCLGRDFFITNKKINLCEFLPKPNKMPYGSLFYEQNGLRLVVPNVSVGVFPGEIPLRTEVIYKRFEDNFATFNGKIRIGQGHFKSFAMKHIYISSPIVSFYVRGDREFIVELLERNLFALGNDIRIGYGTVRKFEIKDMGKKNYSIWADGLAMRPLPVEICEEYEATAFLPYRPPYWSAKEVRECVIPFTPCKIKEPWRPYYG